MVWTISGVVATVVSMVFLAMIGKDQMPEG